MIYECLILSATNTDVLSVGRLNAIPHNGTLTVRVQSDLGTAAANFALTIQMPNGDVPVDNQQVLAGGIIGAIDARLCQPFKFRATQGGHFVISLTETGTAVCTLEVALTP